MDKKAVDLFFQTLKQDQQFNNEQSPTSKPNAKDFWRSLESDQNFINQKLGGE